MTDAAILAYPIPALKDKVLVLLDKKYLPAPKPKVIPPLTASPLLTFIYLVLRSSMLRFLS